MTVDNYYEDEVRFTYSTVVTELRTLPTCTRARRGGAPEPRRLAQRDQPALRLCGNGLLRWFNDADDATRDAVRALAQRAASHQRRLAWPTGQTHYEASSTS